MTEGNLESSEERALRISELEQYLGKSIKPHLMPSTFAILKIEFAKRAEKSRNARTLLEELITFFTRYPGVSERLRALHTGLFLTTALPSSDTVVGPGTATSIILGIKVQIGKVPEGLPSEGAVRAQMPTPTEEQLDKKLYNAETLRPPKGSGQSKLIAITAINDPRQIPRSEQPTISNEAETTQLAEGMKALTEDTAKNRTSGGEVAEVSGIMETASTKTACEAYGGEDQDDPSDRITLIMDPAEKLIARSQRIDRLPPATPQAGNTGKKQVKSGDAPDFSDAEEEWFGKDPKPKDKP